MDELTKLPGLGPVVAGQLRQAGINTPAELRAAGSREAWTRIYAFDPSACYNRLLGLECAVQGVPKNTLDDETKAALKAFFNRAKGKG